MMRRGFTLLELMVASLLLSMLMTILTMIFNQSSIAWTTGTATVAGLGTARQDIAGYLKRADNTLDANGLRPGLQIVSIWNPNANSSTSPLRSDTGGRTLNLSGISGMRMDDREGSLPNDTFPIGTGGGDKGANTSAGVSKDTYVVGVASDGPDGEHETWDDISTFPEDQL